jgi:hypothetical protein
MLIVAGALLVVLGLGSGLILALGSLHALQALPGNSLWLLYPGLTVAGYLLVALATRTANLALFTRFAGGSMLALALVAAAGLVLSGAAMVPPAASPLALWFVLGVGLLLGTAGLTAHRPVTGPA